MKFLYILLLAAILVSVYGSSVEKLVEGVNEDNIKARFDEARSKDQICGFIQTLLSSKKCGLLKNIGDDAYRLIPLDMELVEALAKADYPEVFRSFFMSRSEYGRKSIINYLLQRKAYTTLEDIGESAYQIIPINNTTVKALAKARGSGMFNKLFMSRDLSSRIYIVKELMSLKDYTTLKGLGKSGYKLVPINEKVVGELAGTNDPELIMGFFMARLPAVRKIFVERLISLKAWKALKAIGKDVSDHLPLTHESVRVIVKIDDSDTAKSFYERLPEGGFDTFTKEQFFEELKGLDAYDRFKDVDPERK